ncbi:HAD-like domain-containing protein [Gymnopilus junonius]|uniref:HAD-like domain-containing protein n=1 Tax=Gymnopilus junonius TaxID=109634 RepID=A0A9P5N976_GYMJU|nr:HAD-like domain-containing protein [Gymnopilus junonius]
MLDFLRSKQPAPFRLFTTARPTTTASRKRPPITAILIDISGTLHVGGKPTPDALGGFHRLRRSSLPFRLCSNTSNQSTGSLVKQLEKIGFDLGERQEIFDNEARIVDQQRLVWTSIGVIAKVIKAMALERPYLLLSESAREEVVREISKDNYPKKYDSVVVGLVPSSFDYDHLNTAFRILKGEYTGEAVGHPTKSIPLIAANKSRYIQRENGLALGTGPFVAALENASGTSAHIVGKPTKEFFQMVINDFTRGVDRNPNYESKAKGKIVVIGDDVEVDLGGGALELGLWRVLVKTGKYRPGDEKRPGIVPPDEVYDSFSSFIDSLFRDGEPK